jgi:hypothetical protein
VLLCNAAIFDDRKVLKFLPLVKHFLPSIKSGPMDIKKSIEQRTSYDRLPLRALDSVRGLWREVEANLYLIDTPLMVSYSVNDHVIHPINSETIIDHVYSADIREVIFEDSYHNVAWDNDADVLIEESVQFVHDVLSGEIDSGGDFDENQLIDAEFESIVSGLNLDTSLDTNFLDQLEIENTYRTPRPRQLSLSQASKFSLASILASGFYILLEGFAGGDPLNLGGWPALVLFSVGVGSFIWRTVHKRRDDGDDGAVI